MRPMMNSWQRCVTDMLQTYVTDTLQTYVTELQPSDLMLPDGTDLIYAELSRSFL